MTNRTYAAALIALAAASFCVSPDPAAAREARAATSPVFVDRPTPPPLRARAYLFRGFAGMVFSRGTDKLAERIQEAGFKATVDEALRCPVIANDAVRDYRNDPAPIVIVGHSVGGACAISLAETLEAEQIPVSLIVTTEPNRITRKVPLNVARYINIYQSDSFLGGFDVVPAPGYQGLYASYDIAEHKKISHVNMEKDGAIQEQVMSKILQVAAAPPKPEGEFVPVHYVIPADAPIELWDGGLAVLARPSDTLQTLAAFYQVPLWSLAQTNQVPEDATLVPGQRVIIPRFFTALAASKPALPAVAKSNGVSQKQSAASRSAQPVKH
jgi:hypothetical protein